MEYSARQVAELLGLPVGKIRSYLRSGFLSPTLDADGEPRFTFQDLVLLRTAHGLVEARIAPKRVRTALTKLRDQLPTGRPLTGVAIGAEGRRIVVRDGRVKWNPESGQALFDFDVKDLANAVAPLVTRAARKEKKQLADRAEDWYHFALELETSNPAQAIEAYHRVLQLEPSHAGAEVNLGRLLHESGRLTDAVKHYQRALVLRDDDSTALFNLGVALEDLGRVNEAIAVYENTIAVDPRYADAHYNVARLYEQSGKPQAAVRHLRTYRKLTEGR